MSVRALLEHETYRVGATKLHCLYLSKTTMTYRLTALLWSLDGCPHLFSGDSRALALATCSPTMFISALGSAAALATCSPTMFISALGLQLLLHALACTSCLRLRLEGLALPLPTFCCALNRGAGARPPPRGGPWKPLSVFPCSVGVCDCGVVCLRYCMASCNGDPFVRLDVLVPLVVHYEWAKRRDIPLGSTLVAWKLSSFCVHGGRFPWWGDH